MSTVLRLSVLGLIAAALVVVWAQPDLLDRCGLDPAALSELHEKEARTSQRRETLDRQSEIVQHRISAKQEVIGDLVAGRISFLQAARRFKDLNETPITCQDNYRSRFPGRSDGEKVCRQVLAWLEGELRGLSPSQAASLRCTCEEELEENLRRNDGVVVLP